MKKMIPLILLSLLISGCGGNANGGNGGNDKKDDAAILEQAIKYMNDYNYHFTYTINMNYSGYPDEYASFFNDSTMGPYEFDCDYPRIHASTPSGSINEYYLINNNDYSNLTRYYQKDGAWQKQDGYDITGERNQIKFFDQQKHNVSDYVKDPSEELLFKMTDAKLQENGFNSLFLKINYEKNKITKITVDSLVSYTELVNEEGMNFSYTSDTILRGVLTDFGNIKVTLPM